MSLLKRAHHRVEVMIRLLRLQTNTYCRKFLLRARFKADCKEYLVHVFLRRFVEIARFHVNFFVVAILLVVDRSILNSDQLLQVPFFLVRIAGNPLSKESSFRRDELNKN